VLYFAQLFIPFLGRFSYKNIPEAAALPSFIGSLANFDGEHYLHIAREGYVGINRAFFPLYPYLIKTINLFYNSNIFFIGFLISNILFVINLFLLHEVLKKMFNIKHTASFILLFLAFPTAFFFSAVYTESLFLFTILVSLWAMLKKNETLLLFALVAASLTRLQGVFLVFPLFMYYYDKEGLQALRKPIVYAPFIGLAIYMLFLYQKTGDMLYFANVQSAFGAQRTSSTVLLPQVIYRYLKIFITAQFNFQYFIAGVEFVIFNFCFLLSLYHSYISYKKKRYIELGIGFFSLANLLLPTMTGTLSSMPRYALFALSPYFLLVRTRPNIQFAFFAMFIVLQCILLAFFAQGYFVS
jgi:Gpi18-like mannosyltransferase